MHASTTVGLPGSLPTGGLVNRAGLGTHNAGMRLSRWLTVVCGWCVAGLLACSPTFNWRQVTEEPMGVSLLLPCKPDRAQRAVPLGGQTTTLTMIGCEADGQMFAVSMARLPSGANMPGVLTAWQQLVVLHMGSTQGLVGATPLRPTEPSTRGLRGSLSGTTADGSRVNANVAWLSQGDIAVHAIVFGAKPSGDATDMLFDSLKVQAP